MPLGVRKTVFGLNLAWSLAANSIPSTCSAGKRSCIIESLSCDCDTQSCLFLEQRKQFQERDVAAWNQHYTNGSICNLQPQILTAMPHGNEWQATIFLVPPSQTLLKGQKDGTLPVLQKGNYTSSPLSMPGSSASSLPKAASSPNGRSWFHVEHDRPPALQAADAGTRLSCHKNAYIAMILEHHHYQQQDDIIQWLRDDDYFDGSSSSADVNACDIALLVVFMFFGLNAAISLQQQIRMYDLITIRRSSWCNFTPRQPSHKHQHCQQQQHGQHEAPSYEAECSCCCEAYDVSPSWKRYHNGAAVLRLPILSQACIHSYCLHCARQDRERLVQITPTIMSTATAVEQSFPLCFWARPITASSTTSIRCPFCRQPDAFDIKNPILRPDAYDAYVQEQKAQGKSTSKTPR
jgi:hypothetical protein